MSNQPFTVSRHTITDFEEGLIRLEQHSVTSYFLMDLIFDAVSDLGNDSLKGVTDRGYALDLYNLFLSLRDELERIVNQRIALQTVLDALTSQNREYQAYMSDKSLEVPRPAWLD